MRASDPPGKHLTDEEVVLRVFPVGEGAAPVPLHLAACPECQARVARLREGFLMDRGAIDGIIEAVPDSFWAEQSASIMDRVRVTKEERQNVLPFRLKWNPAVLKRPTLALGSLAAALLLVATLSIARYQSSSAPPASSLAKATPAGGAVDVLVPETDRQDDDLLVSIDQALTEDAPYTMLVPEEL